jgi:hypothetical protein
MSTNNISILILEDFIKKVRFAQKANAKVVTLSILEADELCHNMNLILLKLLDKIQKESSKPAEEIITITMDGGNFDEKR